MLALNQLPAPSATSVMLSRHEPVALQPGAASDEEQATQPTAASVAYVLVGQDAQPAAPPVEYVLAPHDLGSSTPPVQNNPAGHLPHAKNGVPLAANRIVRKYVAEGQVLPVVSGVRV